MVCFAVLIIIAIVYGTSDETEERRIRLEPEPAVTNAQGPSNATMSEIVNLIHKTLEKNGFDDIGVDMRKDEFGVVDFDIYFDENFTSDKFYLVAGSVIGIIAAL